MSQSLLDKRVVVTGGFGALGSALGKYLLAQGAKLLAPWGDQGAAAPVPATCSTRCV